MKNLYLLIVGLFVISNFLFAQVGINADDASTPPDASAGLDVKFSNKGVLIPRLTFEQRNAILNPAEGLMVYCTTCSTDGTGVLSIYQGGKWINFSGNCMTPNVPSAGTHVPSLTQIFWKWNSVPITLGYKWNTIDDFNTATNMGTTTSKTETGLVCWTTYIRYVWAYNACGQSSPLILMQATSQIPFSTAPTAGTHVATETTITWNWNTVSGATGYRWNTSNDFATATEMGTTATMPENGLTCNTAYTRYVWAYNSCGYSTPVALTKSTLPCFVCGSPITINHVAGSVAPVTKTVTYGTVTNIHSGTSICWISSNLGADHQAIASNDNTYASAGWYWQFNRQQGYAHDLFTRIPNTTWIYLISENLDWQTAYDPCSIELGAEWRIPTSTEWTNIDAGGNWTNWTGPWGSSLKMHAAGNLDRNDGVLENQGSYGKYWSSTQGWYLNFNASGSSMLNSFKEYGLSLRCLRNF